MFGNKLQFFCQYLLNLNYSGRSHKRKKLHKSFLFLEFKCIGLSIFLPKFHISGHMKS